MPNTAVIPDERRHRLTVADFHSLAEAGAFGPEERVELIRGELIDMTPIGNRHAAAVRNLINELASQMGGAILVDAQNPIRLGEGSAPQPDVFLLQRRKEGYGGRLPDADDARLVIEIADTSLAYDRDVKLPLYANHGIPEAWLVDLTNDRVQVFTGPLGEDYGHMDLFRTGMTVTSPTLGLELPAETCLPPV